MKSELAGHLSDTILGRTLTGVSHTLVGFADRLRAVASPWPIAPVESRCWPLPADALTVTTASAAGSGGRASTDHAASKGQQWIYLEVLNVGTLRGRLSLQRPRESPEDVYVGFKPGKMVR